MLAPLALVLLPAQTVTLRYLPPIGQSVRSTIVNRMSREFPGQPNATMVQTIPMTTKAISRSKNVTTVQTKTGNVKVDMPAGAGMDKAKQEIEKSTSGKVSTIVVDARSVPKSAVTPGVASVSSVGGFQGVVYPEGPVRVGQSWTYSLDSSRLGTGTSGNSVNGRIPVRYTLTSLTTKGTKRLAIISVALDGKLKLNAQGMATALSLKGNGVITTDVATGIVLGTRMTMDTTVPMGKIGAMKQRMSITMTTS